jgi:hypothetical protein
MADNKIRVHQYAVYSNPPKPSTAEYDFYETYTDLINNSKVQIIPNSFVKTQSYPYMTYVDKSDAEKFISGTLISKTVALIKGSGYGRNEDITYVVYCPQLNKNITWTFNSIKGIPEYYFKLEPNPESNVGGRGKRLTSKHLKRTHMKRTHMKSKHRKRTHKRSKCTGTRR